MPTTCFNVLKTGTDYDLDLARFSCNIFPHFILMQPYVISFLWDEFVNIDFLNYSKSFYADLFAIHELALILSLSLSLCRFPRSLFLPAVSFFLSLVIILEVFRNACGAHTH